MSAARGVQAEEPTVTTVHLPRTLAALVLAIVVLVAQGGFFTPAHAQTPTGTIAGALPRAGGIAVAVWSGGAVDELASAASAQGCTLAAAWSTSNGQFTGYVFGAPAVVNTAFGALYPGTIPPSTALILVCRGAATTTVSTATGDSFDRDLARGIFDGLNRERTSRGLPALTESAILTTTAAKYAAFHWARGLPLTHEGDGTEPWDRARAQGYPTSNVGEIIAAQQRSAVLTAAQYAPIFVQQWMDSPPHRAIVLGESLNATELGVGCAHGLDARGLNFTLCVGDTGKP
jgi:uncharacterized protein YkwD